jgi:LysM repeat protein
LVANTVTAAASENDVPITQQVITPISPLMANVEAESTTDPSAPLTLENANSEGTEEAVDAPVEEVVIRSGDTCTYTVQPGDNLYRIAIGNGFSLDEMRAANPDLVGEAPVLQPGQVLNLPSCEDEVSAPQATDAPAVIGTSIPNQTPVVGGETGGQSYVVQRGDTLLAIANRFGVTVRQLVESNNISDPNRLSVGQVLIIPVSAE